MTAQLLDPHRLSVDRKVGAQGELESRPLPWVPVLMYHRVAPRPCPLDPAGNYVEARRFEAHLRWLTMRGYRGITLAELEGSLGGQVLGRVVAITFDDGYEDNYSIAWPLLKEYGYTATIFVITDLAGTTAPIDRDLGYLPARMLSRDQIRQMHAGDIAFGSHSCSHPPRLGDLDDGALEHEIADSKSALEDILQTEIAHFAYPHGKHDLRVRSELARAGYRLGIATVDSEFSPFVLSRIDAAPARNGPALERQIAGRHGHVMLRRLRTRAARHVGGDPTHPWRRRGS